MKFIDFFVHAAIAKNSHAFYESRMLIVIIYSYLWVMAAFYLFYGFISDTSADEKNLILGLTTGLTIGLLALLVLIKQYAWLKRSGDIIILATFAATVFIVYFTQGPINSPFTVLAFVPAFLSFCLSGLKAGGFGPV